ncbi:hypothetical protein DTO271G3_5083 [Paecilomyces variotii]|nr:hypothetical protein DTO271G3_5083 [Paecilomyces variotii]
MAQDSKLSRKFASSPISGIAEQVGQQVGSAGTKPRRTNQPDSFRSGWSGSWIVNINTQVRRVAVALLEAAGSLVGIVTHHDVSDWDALAAILNAVLYTPCAASYQGRQRFVWYVEDVSIRTRK